MKISTKKQFFSASLCSDGKKIANTIRIKTAKEIENFITMRAYILLPQQIADRSRSVCISSNFAVFTLFSNPFFVVYSLCPQLSFQQDSKHIVLIFRLKMPPTAIRSSVNASSQCIEMCLTTESGFLLSLFFLLQSNKKRVEKKPSP